MPAARRAPQTSGITLAQLNRALERGDIAPVYLLLGEEAFLRRKAIAALRAVVATGDDAGMALERIDGGVASMADVLDAARSLPLFLPATGRPVRIVLVRSFEPGTPVDGDLLGGYLDAPVEATCLVFEAAKLDSRRVAAKLLLSRATVVDCTPPEREADVRRWIENSAKARGFGIDAEGVTYLLEMVGLDLQQLDQELGKVAPFAANGEPMVARDLEQLLGRSREHSVFELTDALVAGRLEAALQVLSKLLDDGEEPIRILAMVAWVIRQLIIARDLSGRGCPERELLQQLGGRWNQRRLVLQKAARCDLGALEDLLVSCSQSDAAVKMQRGAGGRGVLERLCRRVCAA